jgi:hypothetical protein
LEHVAFDQRQPFLREGCRELLAEVMDENGIDLNRY